MRFLGPFVLLCLATACTRPEPGLTVFAAASTADVLAEIVAAYEATSGTEVRLNFGSSGVLARQIASGAPADVFLSASEEWVDYLVENGLAEGASRRVPMRNRLVLVASGKSRGEDPGPTDPAAALVAAEGHVAMGDPGHVPAGRYAREALTSLGLYDLLAGENRLLFAQNVRAALALVELGECDLGIVYATDARRSSAVRALYTFQEDTHGPINYSAVVTADASTAVDEFVAFLCGTDAAAVFEHHGFIPVAQSGP